MAKCIIVCAAEVTRQDWEDAAYSPGDFVIAADKGYIRLDELNVIPHMIVGDFDSAPKPERPGVQIETYPVHKDDTDCLLAVRRGWECGMRDFVILGALGGKRLDHTVANLQTLDYIARIGGSGMLISGGTFARVVRMGSLRVHRTAGKISVFAMGESCSGVNLRGVEYPLKDYTLTCGFPLGVSNAFAEEYAEISVEWGSLLVIWTSQDCDR